MKEGTGSARRELDSRRWDCWIAAAVYGFNTSGEGLVTCLLSLIYIFRVTSLQRFNWLMLSSFRSSSHTFSSFNMRPKPQHLTTSLTAGKISRPISENAYLHFVFSTKCSPEVAIIKYSHQAGNPFSHTIHIYLYVSFFVFTALQPSDMFTNYM